jgi:tetratricopeptide (TPR) repeat protein
MAQVMALLPKQPAQALAAARAWRSESPGDVMALIALGECLEKTGDLRGAARAYGSIIDLFPARADLRRFAGQRLERLPAAEAAALAIDTYRQAALQRPDHPSSHRLYAFALLRAGKLADAFAAIETGLAQDYPGGRFAGARQILSEDLGLVAAAWIKAEADKKPEILKRLARAGGAVENAPSLRFVLNWETDANDVDFHIYDGKGNHAYYSTPRLRSGGQLYADVTTGYGPECFTIRGKPRAYPYTLQAHYYSRGPMGYGMGKLEVVEHDGKGGLRFDQRPFVIMKDGAFIDMGQVTQ